MNMLTLLVWCAESLYEPSLYIIIRFHKISPIFIDDNIILLLFFFISLSFDLLDGIIEEKKVVWRVQ